MERVLSEPSIVRYTAPLKIRDKLGNYVPCEQRVPTEVSSKVDRGDIKFDDSQRLQDLLNSVLPPRQWEENGEVWIQQVSPEPITRQDVIELQLLVDRRLKSLKALDAGIDPVRRHVYSQLMDELIRQELISNPERGIVLLKVRDELKMTLDTNQALFENGKIYGPCKAAEATRLRQSLSSRFNCHLKEKNALLSEVISYRAKCKDFERESLERILRFDNVCIDELRLLNDIGIGLKQQIRDVFLELNTR